MDLEGGEEDEEEDPNAIKPDDIRRRLLDERRKNFSKKWHTKFNQAQKQKERQEFTKKGRGTSSAIGEER